MRAPAPSLIPKGPPGNSSGDMHSIAAMRAARSEYTELLAEMKALHPDYAEPGFSQASIDAMRARLGAHALAGVLGALAGKQAEGAPTDRDRALIALRTAQDLNHQLYQEILSTIAPFQPHEINLLLLMGTEAALFERPGEPVTYSVVMSNTANEIRMAVRLLGEVTEKLRAQRDGLKRTISWSKGASASERAWAVAMELAKGLRALKAEVAELRAELAAVKDAVGTPARRAPKRKDRHGGGLANLRSVVR